jgi:hypothetical protein
MFNFFKTYTKNKKIDFKILIKKISIQKNQTTPKPKLKNVVHQKIV